MDNFKICSSCKIKKELQFFKRTESKCKECISIQSKEYRNRPEVKARYAELGKIYYSKPENRKRQREWQKENRTTVVAPRKKRQKSKGIKKSKLIEIDGKIYKLCTTCKELKSITKFSKSKAKNRRSSCKSCCNEKLKDYQRNGWGRVNYNRRRKVEPYLDLSSIVFLESYNVKQFLSSKFTCEYCKSTIEETYHLDHIVPISKGGTNELVNLSITCKKCNLSKSSHLLDEWNLELSNYVERRNESFLSSPNIAS